NVISGNGQYGVALFGIDAQQNSVLGNLIGTDVSGTQAIGNSNSGVFIESGVNNLIGGISFAGQTGGRGKKTRHRDSVQLVGGNMIAFNGSSSADAGIFVAAGER